jgi:glutamate 5-kinase
VPIINENDTVATSEIRYGDNDRLAARVATMAGADLLVLLSDIDGLYTAPPHLDPDAQFLETIAEITPEIEAMAGGAASELSRGGMRTKIDAGKIATTSGCAMIIASGKPIIPLKAIENGARSSWFAPSGTPVTARKTWIAGQLQPAGELHVDDGAERGCLGLARACCPPAFARSRGVQPRRYGGDHRSRWTRDRARPRRLRRRGSAADHRHANREIEAILGYAGRAAMVHRDDMVMTSQSVRNRKGRRRTKPMLDTVVQGRH